MQSEIFQIHKYTHTHTQVKALKDKLQQHNKFEINNNNNNSK